MDRGGIAMNDLRDIDKNYSEKIPMTIERLLRNVGIFLIVVGILGGLIGWFSIDHETYKNAKETFEELSTNEFAEAAYNTAKSMWISQVSMVLTSVFASVIGGLVLMGFGKIIELQKRMIEVLEKK